MAKATEFFRVSVVVSFRLKVKEDIASNGFLIIIKVGTLFLRLYLIFAIV